MSAAGQSGGEAFESAFGTGRGLGAAAPPESPPSPRDRVRMLANWIEEQHPFKRADRLGRFRAGHTRADELGLALRVEMCVPALGDVPEASKGSHPVVVFVYDKGDARCIGIINIAFKGDMALYLVDEQPGGSGRP